MAEAGFVTNEEEYKKLIDPYYQSEIAQGIASAVSDVIDQIYPGTGRTMEN
jgi:N-acetylmuramoyl-L-alanine amidase